MTLAPIVLFAYNRPDHLLSTLNALKENDLADQSTLYIFCDGPKSNATKEQLVSIEQVRIAAKSNQWCKEVNIIERIENLGLAQSIITGVTEIVNKYGRVVVLEDDLVTSKGFLRYMNQALNMYQDESQVMHISGYMFPINTKNIRDTTTFYNSASCWGWGTWANKWCNFNSDAQYIYDHVVESGRSRDFNIGGFGNFLRQLRKNINGTMDTWAIKWYGSIFIRNGHCLHPTTSLVRNIGNDDSGTNSKKSQYYDSTLIEYINIKKIPLKENTIIRKKMITYYFNQKRIKHTLLYPLIKLFPSKF